MINKTGQFIDCGAGVVCTELVEAWGFWQGGGHHRAAWYTPPAAANQRRFFNAFASNFNKFFTLILIPESATRHVPKGTSYFRVLEDETS